MKNLLTIGATLLIAINCFATGAVPGNSAQSGVVGFTSATGLSLTNTFSVPFTISPVVTTYNLVASSTVSAITITTTNFVLTVTNLAGTLTNGSVAWQAYLPYDRIQSGSQTGASTNVTFGTPYFSAPTVVISQSLQASATNGMAAITSISATGFTFQSATTNQTFYWIANGPGTSPGTSPVTY